jgi:hypothetical protein
MELNTINEQQVKDFTSLIEKLNRVQADKRASNLTTKQRVLTRHYFDCHSGFCQFQKETCDKYFEKAYHSLYLQVRTLYAQGCTLKQVWDQLDQKTTQGIKKHKSESNFNEIILVDSKTTMSQQNTPTIQQGLMRTQSTLSLQQNIDVDKISMELTKLNRGTEDLYNRLEKVQQDIPQYISKAVS